MSVFKIKCTQSYAEGRVSKSTAAEGPDLVLGFEHQQVGDVSERQTQADHLGLCDVTGKLADVDDPGWDPRTSYVTFELLIVVAIGYENRKRQQAVNYIRSVKTVLDSETDVDLTWGAHDIRAVGDAGEKLVRSSLKRKNLRLKYQPLHVLPGQYMQIMFLPLEAGTEPCFTAVIMVSFMTVRRVSDGPGPEHAPPQTPSCSSRGGIPVPPWRSMRTRCSSDCSPLRPHFLGIREALSPW